MFSQCWTKAFPHSFRMPLSSAEATSLKWVQFIPPSPLGFTSKSTAALWNPIGADFSPSNKTWTRKNKLCHFQINFKFQYPGGWHKVQSATLELITLPAGVQLIKEMRCPTKGAPVRFLSRYVLFVLGYFGLLAPCRCYWDLKAFDGSVANNINWFITFTWGENNNGSKFSFKF